jgi:hypothetical protein
MVKQPGTGDAVTPLQLSGPKPPTPKDGALADNQLLLRKLLLHAPEVQGRFRDLHGLAAFTDAKGGLHYWEEVSRLVRDLDGTWSGAEINAFAADWPAQATRIAEGWPRVGFGFSAGRPGRGKRRLEPVVRLAADSIALRAGGLGAFAADCVVAEAEGTTPTTITGYRKHLRDDRA